jgi:hypothetical protein
VTENLSYAAVCAPTCRYCAFWDAPGGRLSSKPKKAIYGKAGTRQTQSAVMFLSGALGAARAWTGTGNGAIYIWQGSNLSKVQCCECAAAQEAWRREVLQEAHPAALLVVLLGRTRRRSPPAAA